MAYRNAWSPEKGRAVRVTRAGSGYLVHAREAHKCKPPRWFFAFWWYRIRCGDMWICAHCGSAHQLASSGWCMRGDSERDAACENAGLEPYDDWEKPKL